MSFPLFLLRHGETEWNRTGRYQGESDIPLNDTGRAQAAGIAARLKAALAGHGLRPTDVGYVSSSLGRAQETMEIVREGLGLPRRGFETRDDLKEIAIGVWSGLTQAEILARPDGHLLLDGQVNRWTGRPDGGESFEDLRARVLPWFRSRTGPIVVTCHGQVSRVCRGDYLGLPPRETLALKIPQDAFFMLSDGVVTEI